MRFLLLLLLLCSAFARAEMREPLNTGDVPSNQLPKNLRQVSVTQKIGGRIPLDLAFVDELGRPVRLKQVLNGKPIILTLAYFRCPGLCTLVLTGVVNAIRRIPQRLGNDFQVLTVSIDPKEGPALARAKKRSYLARYSASSASDDAPGWRMLTGKEPEIRKLAESVGFHYLYDSESGQYSHASVAVVLTPEGKVSQYFFGIRYPPELLSQALQKASSSKLGSPITAILLYCFHYDPASGGWSLRILNIMRVFGAITVVALFGFLLMSYRKETAA